MITGLIHSFFGLKEYFFSKKNNVLFDNEMLANNIFAKHKNYLLKKLLSTVKV